MFDFGIMSSHTFDIPIINVGNITVGGTGKTPHSEWLMKQLGSREIAVLSRGYGRKSRGFQWVETDSDSQQVGDEPLQMKRKFPETLVAVCEKRVVGIETILAHNAGIKAIVLDDAYQHRHVKPSFNVLLNDYNRPIYNDFMLPTGNLREFARGAKRANAIIVTKCPENLSEDEKEQIIKKLVAPSGHVFFTSYKYGKLIELETHKSRQINDYEHILLVTGIANTTPLQQKFDGVEVTHLKYPDHHAFSAKDVRHIIKTFEAIPVENKKIVTTEKDAVRLMQFKDLLQDKISYICRLPIQVAFHGSSEAKFKSIIKEHVTTGK
jgi:tetraacyldisaccharide 4'-kinase